MQWMDRASCLHEDPELFFPIGTGPQAEEQAEAAKVVCRSCPVLDECVKWALSPQGPEFGIVGGMTEGFRGQVSRSAKRAHRRTLAKQDTPE
jgi:WhiB family redox-sensing transcriptional regulator